jgi:hypothetical protein
MSEKISLLDAVRMYITAYNKKKEHDAKKVDGDEGIELGDFLNSSFEVLIKVAFEEENTMKPAPNQEMLALENVRDLLGKGQTELAIKYIDGIVNKDEALGALMTQFPYVGAFESSFKTAMRKHNVIAGFVIVEPMKKADNSYTYRMITGGHHIADAVLSYHLRPLADSLGKDIGPKKDFTEVVDIVRRAALNPNRIGR